MLTGHVRCVSRWLILHAIAMLTDHKAIVAKNYLRVKQIQILFKTTKSHEKICVICTKKRKTNKIGIYKIA